MMNFRGAILGAAMLLLPGVASAQFSYPVPNTSQTAPGVVNMCLNGSNQAVACSSGTPLPVSGTFSATLGGFAPAGTFATITATASSASVALPAGAVVIFQNTGTTAVSCTLGIGSATASASQNIVQPASWLALTVGSNTFGACIDVTGSASNVVVLTGGSGLPTGAGGGSGGGGGGAVTVADGADVALGAKADAAWASGSGSVIALLKNIAAGVASPLAAGTAIAGKFGIDQTTPGTTNGVQVNAALPAGTNTIGTVGQLPYPVGAVPYTASTTGTTAATTATLAGAASVTTYICGFSIRANATAAATGNATVTGTITGTLNFTQWTAPTASGLGITEMVFAPCIPASAVNTSIAVVSAAPGTGGVVSVTSWGYKL